MSTSNKKNGRSPYIHVFSSYIHTEVHSNKRTNSRASRGSFTGILEIGRTEILQDINDTLVKDVKQGYCKTNDTLVRSVE